jgi:hypothetical protein
MSNQNIKFIRREETSSVKKLAQDETVRTYSVFITMVSHLAPFSLRSLASSLCFCSRANLAFVARSMSLNLKEASKHVLVTKILPETLFKLLPFRPSDILLDLYVTCYCFTLYTPSSHFSSVK